MTCLDSVVSLTLPFFLYAYFRYVSDLVCVPYVCLGFILALTLFYSVLLLALCSLFFCLFFCLLFFFFMPFAVLFLRSSALALFVLLIKFATIKSCQVMSLMSAPDASANSAAAANAEKLRSADQYETWKLRIGDVCWASTNVDIFSVTDEHCLKALAALEKESKKDAPPVMGIPANWVNRCWLTITGALHDEVYRKVAHCRRGLIKTLLDEIPHALVVADAQDPTPLRLALYGSNMQRDGHNDLQTWVSFVTEKAAKLEFLKKKVPEEELVAIFLKGLHPVFQQLQVYFAIPGQMPTTFEAAVSVCRRFALSPTVAAELAKLKSPGSSQSMFPAAVVETAQPNIPTVRCMQYARRGTCQFGNRCRFSHAVLPSGQSQATLPQNPPSQTRRGGTSRLCTYCTKPGHTQETCFSKARALALAQGKPLPAFPTRPPLNMHVLSTAVDAAEPAAPAPAAPPAAAQNRAHDPLMFVFTVASTAVG